MRTAYATAFYKRINYVTVSNNECAYLDERITTEEFHSILIKLLKGKKIYKHKNTEFCHGNKF